MHWRLNDNDRRASIPDHVLSKFLAEANKLYERRRAEQSRETGAPMDVLDVVKTSNLSSQRRRELLQAELDRTRERERDLVEALTEGEL